MYDWANSAFSTTIMALYFPIFFKDYYSVGVPATDSTFYLGLSNTVAALLIGLAAPMIGALADVGGYKKRFVVFFAFWGAIFASSLGLVSQGQYLLAAMIYALASLFHALSLGPYDSLIVDVSEGEDVDMVSAWGYSLGYLGGGLLVLLNNAMVMFPEKFGLLNAAEGVKWSFVSVGIWWMIWTAPFIFNVKENKRVRASDKIGEQIKLSYLRLKETVTHILGLKSVLMFLLAFFLYNDGLGTVIKMSVDFGKAINIENKHLIGALTMVQFIGFPMTLVFGKIASRFTPKKAIYGGLVIYSFVVIWAYFMNSVWEFYLMAFFIGAAQGGVQSVSRSLYSRLIPKERSGEFFGFFNLLGKFIGLLGPLMVGITAKVTENPRIGILSILSLFVAGAMVLMKVEQPTKGD